MKHKNVLLIGVDGGATEVKAHAAVCDDLNKPTAFDLRPESSARVYPRVAGFTPVPVAQQLAQRDADAIELSRIELEQGEQWIAAATEVIINVAGQCQAKRILIGMGMPGLKTADGCGINVINNGPRMPDLLNTLEQRLSASGLELAAPIAALGSDADYCGLGEEYAADGLFRDVDSAYYVGCGTGIADALKLRGELMPFDRTKSWIQKSWQMSCVLGATFEKLVSAKSLNRVYAELLGRTESPAGAQTGEKADRFPETDAVVDHGLAQAWLHTAALVLAELVFERLWTVKNGRAIVAYRDESYAKLDRDHAYSGLLLERVIIGQRVGQIYAEPAYHAFFGQKFDACLAAMIYESGDTELISACLSNGDAKLRSGFVVPSKLRAAPALGAAVAAVRAVR